MKYLQSYQIQELKQYCQKNALPSQVIKILNEIKEYTFERKYAFPSYILKNKPMSDNTLITALRRIGFSKEEFVPHSFIASFQQ